MAQEVMAALSYLAASNQLPVRCNRLLESTLAAVFVLCQRACLAPEIFTTRPEMLMAALWVLEQYHRHVSLRLTEAIISEESMA